MILPIILLRFFCFVKGDEIIATLYYDKSNGYHVKRGILDYEKGIMFVKYKSSYEKVGWDFLSIISTNRTDLYTDEQLSYAQGYLEGYITQKRIYNWYLITHSIAFQNISHPLPESAVSFLSTQKKYVMSKPSDDPYWKHAQDTYQIIEGLYDGYNDVAPKEQPIPTIWNVIMCVSLGDLLSVMKLMSGAREYLNPDLLNGKLDLIPGLAPIITNSHCSGFVNYDADSDDFYFGQSTWAWYAMNYRIFKQATLHFSNPLVKANTVAFSSYPGTPISNDDFYGIADQNMLVFETSLSCFNKSLGDEMTPYSLLTWQRVLLANRFSSSGPEWGKYFVRENSGTYNDEFIILDGKVAKERVVRTNPDTKKKELVSLPPHSLTLVEQIPANTWIVDISDQFVKQGNYFPGYNVPYVPEAYDLCDYPGYIKQHPEGAKMLDYNNCVRAKIFRRDHNTVNSIESLKRIMRYNNYTTDPISEGNPNYAILARWDLGKDNPQCGGGLDAKVASLKEWMTEKKIHIFCSPKFSATIPPFEFDKGPEICNAPGSYHEGVISKWDKFDWMEYTINEFP